VIAAFDSFAPGEQIPARDYLKDRKLEKYFSRETASAVVSMGRLRERAPFDGRMPVYYATGIGKFEDFNLAEMMGESRGPDGRFSPEAFLSRGIINVSPLTQFKILSNMPLCLVSIAFGLRGDNAAVYSYADGLMLQALYGPNEYPVVVGAGKVYADGRVESGFALVSRDDVEAAPFRGSRDEAIEIIRYWAGKQ